MMAFIIILRVSELYYMDIIPAFFFKITLGTREVSQWLWVCYCCSRDLNWLPASLSGIAPRNQKYLASLRPALPYTYRSPPPKYTQLKVIKIKITFIYCVYVFPMVCVCTNMNVWVCKSENILKSQFSLLPNSGFLTNTFPHQRQVYSPLIPASPDNEVFYITKGRVSSNLIYLSCFSLICKNKRQVGLGGTYYIKTNKQ